MLGMNRRGAPPGPPMNAPPLMDDSGGPWKPGPPDNQSMMGPGNPDNGPGNPGGFPPGGNPFPGSVFQQTGQSSPAGNQSMGGYPGGPQPGSNTPQYTGSPAPSGSSTPGPCPPQNVGGGFPQPPNSAGPPFNGPNAGPGGPFGSPSGNGPPFGRPNSSGPAFGGGPPGPPGPGPHFGSPGGPGGFGGGPQFGGMPPGSPFGHGPGPGHPMMGGPQQIDRMDQGPRRHNFSHTEYRVFELNKRLQQRTEESDNCWWDSFTTEFFEDDARLAILFCLEDGPKRYTIGRTLIPRFFRSIFEGGASDLYFHLKHAKESFHHTSITLDCDHCTVITQHGKQPFITKVCANARLVLEFIHDDYMRIKSWHMTIKGHRELIPRSLIGTSIPPDPMVLDQLSKNITRAGITNSTLNYLRLCVILEPMQELMSRHKAYALSPRDCLKTTLFQKWQRMVAPPGKKDPQRPANKRRKRKGSSSGGGAAGNNTPPVPSQKRSPSGPNFSLASQDVMVVGEPTLMGGEFGEEDERLITRLENTQYDAANALDHDNHPAFGHADSPMSVPNPWHMDRSGGIPQSPGGNGPQGGPQGPGGNPSNQDIIDKKSPAVSQ